MTHICTVYFLRIFQTDICIEYLYEIIVKNICTEYSLFNYVLSLIMYICIEYMNSLYLVAS